MPAAGIDLRKYVGPESGGLLSRIIFVYSSPKTSYATQRELRNQDLIQTAEDRRWSVRLKLRHHPVMHSIGKIDEQRRTDKDLNRVVNKLMEMPG